VLSGWEPALTAPLFERFMAATGFELTVDADDSFAVVDELLAGNVDADLVLAHAADALGLLAEAGLLAPLSAALLERVDARFQAADGDWIGVSGRALVFVFNPDRIAPDALPDSVLALALPRWRTLLGWAPETETFAALTAALVAQEGADAADEWLTLTMANRPRLYDSSLAVAQAVAAGEIAAGIVSHTDLLALVDKPGDELPVGVHWFGEVERYDPARGGDAGALMALRGAAVLQAAAQPEAAAAFIAFLLSPEAQELLVALNAEYPLLHGVDADPRLLPLDRLQTPALDLSDERVIETTQELLQDLGDD
jgi:iron(III) transport system substrate-binding protein